MDIIYMYMDIHKGAGNGGLEQSRVSSRCN